jgi:LysM repeat protein
MERTGEPRNRRSDRKRAEQTVQTLVAALLLGTTSGCATVDMDHARAPLTNMRPAARPVTVVLVQRGDTVANIARRYGLSSQSIIDANALAEPYQLMRGQRLVLPPSTVHIVAPGETVSSISRSYAVSRQAIVDANDIGAPDSLYPGQRLAIPYVGPRPTRAVAQVTPVKMSPLPAATVESRGSDPRLAGARYYAMGKPRPKPVLDGQGGPEFRTAASRSGRDEAKLNSLTRTCNGQVYLADRGEDHLAVRAPEFRRSQRRHQYRG